MIRYSVMKKESLGRICRNCLNKKYRLNLRREDCSYLYFRYQCGSCGCCKNIVTGIRPVSRWKLLTGKK